MIEFVWELHIFIDGDLVSDGPLFLSLEGAKNKAQAHCEEPNPDALTWQESEEGFEATISNVRYQIHPVEVHP